MTTFYIATSKKTALISAWLKDGLLLATISSLAIHIMLILLLPGLKFPERKEQIRGYTEVKLIPLKIKKGKVRPKVKKPLPKTTSEVTERPATPESGDSLLPYISSLGKQYQISAPLPSVTPPTTKLPRKEDTISLLPAAAFPLGKLTTPSKPGRVLKPVFLPNKGTKENSQAANQKFSFTEIKWGGRPRKTRSKPKIPKYSLPIEGEVELKFWVDAKGRVSSVEILKKLDAELERLAIEYMKKWRFTVLPSKEEKLQWGIITIKFRLD